MQSEVRRTQPRVKECGQAVEAGKGKEQILP